MVIADFSAPFVICDTIVSFQNLTNASTSVVYFWDFGDGNTASGQTVSHTFAADGAYFIGLLGYNANGILCDSTGQYLTIVGCGGNTPCQAGFQFSTDSSCTYTFYGYGANSYEWWYDDMVLIGEIVTLYISPNSIETLCMYAYDNQGYVCDTVCEDIVCDISGLSELDNHLDVSVRFDVVSIVGQQPKIDIQIIENAFYPFP